MTYPGPLLESKSPSAIVKQTALKWSDMTLKATSTFSSNPYSILTKLDILLIIGTKISVS